MKTPMKTQSLVSAAAVMLVAGLAGCTDLKPLQMEVTDLKSQVAKLQSDSQAARTAADQAGTAAHSAEAAAGAAQSTANQALAASQSSQQCCNDTNEKLDRMFKRSVSK